MPGVEAPVVVCNRAHVEAIRTQLAEVGLEPQRIVAEPTGRNTAAAIAAAAVVTPADGLMLVLPADHVITGVGVFRGVVEEAAEAAAGGLLVTFGVVPDRPETGYGYIEAGEGTGTGALRKVARFVEKPDAATAAAYVAGGRFLWNSGMFVFSPDVILAELERWEPEVTAAVWKSLARVDPASAVVEPSDAFEEAPALSIDTAVMERTDRAAVIPLDAGWSDVGSWATLWDIEERDSHDNVVRGDAVVLDVNRSYVRSAGRLVAVVGIDDVVVVDTGDAVLVAARDRVQEVKHLVERLTAHGRPEVH
jgi:mannose-1-phosphate guanylyltransferase/mannose-6-phosphate isomerase